MSIRATNFVRRLRGLTPSEKLVALVLADHAHHKTGESRPSMTTIAEEGGFENRETASRITDRLAELKVITTPCRSKGRNPTVWYFNYDLVNCDSIVTVAPFRTVTPQSQSTVTQENSNRDFEPVENGSTVTLEGSNRDSTVTGRVYKGKERKGKAGEGGSPNGSLAAAAVTMGNKIETAFKSLGIHDEPFGSLVFKMEFTRVFFEFRPHENILHSSLPDLLEAVIHSCQLKNIQIPKPFYFEKQFAEVYRDLKSDYIFRPAQTREVRGPDD
jgi:hypothetical protein